jgi:trafficking protein particle complex subunit 8
MKTFVREMVTQSVLPTMERSISVWNEETASRRRGISGRFKTLGKWAGFGSSKSSTSGSSGKSDEDYNAALGYYLPKAPEAIIRRLADHAFMVRDWKLAQSTYDLLRSDFNNDKAWKYHAGAQEMAALSLLLSQQSMSAKARSDTVDQMLENACYSYLTRCSAPYGALRCLALATELLRLRGGSAADDAARWGTRILETKIAGRIGSVLFTERIGSCYLARKGAGSGHWGSRRRKAAMWYTLAAELWLTLDKYVQAEKCLGEASRLYKSVSCSSGEEVAFGLMKTHIEELRSNLRDDAQMRNSSGGIIDQEVDTIVEVESETFKPHRQSLVGGTAIGFSGLQAGPLSPVRVAHDEPHLQDDSFE